MELRYYQQEAIDAIMEEWTRVKSTLLVLPTGCGKTIVFCKLSEMLLRKGARILILAHRGELLDQARDKMKKATGLDCAVEKAGETAIDSFYRVTVGSVQSLHEDRLKKFPKNYYSHIIIDEAHHALSDTYLNVINYFEDAYLLGVTATPDRGDKKNLSQVFQTLAYEYSLPKAIKEKFLSPIRALTLPIEIDMNAVKIKAGDFSEADIDNALAPLLPLIADAIVHYASNRKTVVFLPLIATSIKMMGLLNQRGMRAIEVNGTSFDRKEVLNKFSRGEYNVICNSMLLTEGWDEPSVDTIVCLRPTKVRSLFCQIVGRGTRLYEGKEHLLLLDFLWHSEKHDLCKPAHLIADDEFERKQMIRIMDANAKSGKPQELDIQEVELTSKKGAEKERENALAKELKELEGKKKRLLDPVAFAHSLHDDVLEHYTPKTVHEMGLPTQPQRDLLERYGINPDIIKNYGYASNLIEKLNKRNQLGLATPKQIKFLQSRGFKNVESWTQDQASKMFVRIQKNNWNIPNGVVPSQFKPA